MVPFQIILYRKIGGGCLPTLTFLCPPDAKVDVDCWMDSNSGHGEAGYTYYPSGELWITILRVERLGDCGKEWFMIFGLGVTPKASHNECQSFLPASVIVRQLSTLTTNARIIWHILFPSGRKLDSNIHSRNYHSNKNNTLFSNTIASYILTW